MQLFEGLDLVHPIREVGKETKNIQGPAGFESLASRTVGSGSTIMLQPLLKQNYFISGKATPSKEKDGSKAFVCNRSWA